jgi:UDP-glucose 4-epimerase
MRKALITGAAGFLGQHIAHYFLNQGWEVVAIDRGVARLPEHNYYNVIRLALPDVAIEGVLARTQPDVIIHCAGKASVAESIQDPRSDHSSQVGITDHLLRTASRSISSLSRFVYLSSAAVYGNPEAMPVVESSRLAPISPYGEHKKLAEALCQHAHRSLGMPTTIARIFSAYGPGLKRQVVYEACRQAHCNGNVRLQGSGKETRDFIHATDVAQAIYLLATSDAAIGKPFNVATGVEISIEEVASLICEKTAAGVPSFSENKREGDPERWVADITALKGLGFSATFDFEAGLDNTLEWIRTIPCE